MRAFVSLLSLCALLAGQTPFTACPAAAASDLNDGAAAQPAATGGHHHHYGAAVTPGAGDVAVTVPRPSGDADSCTMLTRCDWVAVPTQPVGSELLRGFASVRVNGLGDVPIAAEPSFPTPPPRPLS